MSTTSEPHPSSAPEYFRFRGENFTISTDENPVYYAFLSYRWDHNSSFGRALYKGYFKKGKWDTDVVIIAPKSIQMKWPSGFSSSNHDTPKPLPLQYQERMLVQAGVFLTSQAERDLQYYFDMISNDINMTEDQKHYNDTGVWTSYSEDYTLTNERDFKNGSNKLMDWVESEEALVPHED